MNKTVFRIYALIVCFVCLCGVLINLGTAVYDGFRVVRPGFTLSSSTWERHQSDEAYTKNWSKNKPKPEGEELTKLRESSWDRERLVEKRKGAQSMVKSTIYVVIFSIVFLVHRTGAKKEK